MGGTDNDALCEQYDNGATFKSSSEDSCDEIYNNADREMSMGNGY